MSDLDEFKERYRRSLEAFIKADPLAEHGHGYLAALSPLVAVLCAVACAGLLLGVARGLPELSGQARFGRMWVSCAAALFGVYAGQELIRKNSAWLCADYHTAELTKD